MQILKNYTEIFVSDQAETETPKSGVNTGNEWKRFESDEVQKLLAKLCLKKKGQHWSFSQVQAKGQTQKRQSKIKISQIHKEKNTGAGTRHNSKRAERQTHVRSQHKRKTNLKEIKA